VDHTNKAAQQQIAATRFEKPVNGPSDRPDVETERPRVVTNADNEGISPWGNERSAVGYVDEVNGEGAEEVAGHVPTRHELIQMAKYWYGTVLENSFLEFAWAQGDCSNNRLFPYAQRRINRVAALVGEETVKKATKQVRDEFEAKVDNPWLWDVFVNENEQQRRAAQDELHRKMAELPTVHDRQRLGELGSKFKDDFVAMVFNASEGDQCQVALLSHANREPSGILQASRQFEFVTDEVTLKCSAARRSYAFKGFLRIARRDGEWLFEFPDSSKGSDTRDFLEGVTVQVRKALHAWAEKSFRFA
jgi:hypothetical protein